MVHSSASVNSARRTTNSVKWHHITEDLNPQEHQSTCLELCCILRSAVNYLLIVCHLPVCPPQFITEIYEYKSLLHSSTRHTGVKRGQVCIPPNFAASCGYCTFKRYAIWQTGGERNSGTVVLL